MIKNKKEYQEFQEANQLLLIIDSMQGDGWRADMPLLQVQAAPGIDTVMGEEFLKDMNKEIDKVLSKWNPKIHKRIDKVKKESLTAIDVLEGYKEEVFKRHPLLDPDYVAPELGQEGPNLPKGNEAKV
jgi:hypothetical protein